MITVKKRLKAKSNIILNKLFWKSQKQFWAQKGFGTKEKFWVKKNLGSKIIFDPKIFLVQIEFGCTIRLGSKKNC